MSYRQDSAFPEGEDEPWLAKLREVGVRDGDRTRYLSGHNRALYQMSYTHHKMVPWLVGMSFASHERIP